ncbi:hypothetical protein ILYODFUR_008081 [Ilyodon furcidens]|uniref:Uncharacterized protein n=1 Tax=Ilyodon furcidens TaxID=33524 RepID=A0ABV0UIE8_9TELE
MLLWRSWGSVEEKRRLREVNKGRDNSALTGAMGVNRIRTDIDKDRRISPQCSDCPSVILKKISNKSRPTPFPPNAQNSFQILCLQLCVFGSMKHKYVLLMTSWKKLYVAYVGT